MFARLVAAGLAAGLIGVATPAHGQLLDATADAVRVTVSMNADGSRTVYEFDSAHHKAKATTTAKDGKLVGRILYVLDDAGRFASGESMGRTINSASGLYISMTRPAGSARKSNSARTTWSGTKSFTRMTKTGSRRVTPFTTRRTK
jgi:hypothetical protein